MTAFRIASFVCHTLPDVRIRLRHEGRLLAEVGWDVTPHRDARSGIVRLRPCQLRSAVAEAWQHQRDGRRLGVLGLSEDVDPVIEVGVRGETIQHPGGILTVACADRWIHAFAVTLSCDQTREAIVRSEPDVGEGRLAERADATIARVDLHHDELLGVTLVWTETAVPSGAHPAARRGADATLDMMRRLLAACAVAEFENELHQLV